MQHLPAPWVDRIFERLSVAYGHRFLGLYSGFDMQAVRADWAQTLAAFADNPGAIRHGLDSLPAEPPTAIQFRAICLTAPRPATPQLPAPPANPAAVAAVLQSVKTAKAATATLAPSPTHAVLRNILAIATGRDLMSAAQRSFAQTALTRIPDADALHADFSAWGVEASKARVSA